MMTMLMVMPMIHIFVGDRDVSDGDDGDGGDDGGDNGGDEDDVDDGGYGDDDYGD